MTRTFVLFLYIIFFTTNFTARAEDGYRLWLRYDKLKDEKKRQYYSNQIKAIYFQETSPTLSIAKKEIMNGLEGLLGKTIPDVKSTNTGTVSVYKYSPNKKIGYKINYEQLGTEGFAIITTTGSQQGITLTANTDIGILYGTFYLLRLLQTHQDLPTLYTSTPRIQNRILNHWDNLNRTVERGYAGLSIWNWHTLPDYIDQRYIDYARANASIGINGTVLTNVNANALVLTPSYLLKVKALADVFRPYGIKVYLTARFSAPIEIGGLKTADPLNDSVRNWWKQKAAEIYSLIPDFGGFLVKANSEGQPGPQNYGRTHADGANMLADAVAAYKGIVIWRAFVYDVRVQKSHEDFETQHGSNEPSIASSDRFKQAYAEFKPLDGKFRKNVLVQVKNGPIDFQPREPFSPLFGAMPKTPLVMEFQITQEYTGQGTHLFYEAPMFKEVLDADTYQQGKGSTVASVVDGGLHQYAVTGIAGVANIGNERNWTHHPFGQANWYAFGRLAWNNELSSEAIATEWIRQTFSNDPTTFSTIQKLMMTSREAVVNYMTPLGLHHIMATSHHYGPGPWVNDLGRADWNPIYYHRADSLGIGFDRTSAGSNALSQYTSPLQSQWSKPETTEDKYLLWFHHVPWTYKIKSGRTLWDELCNRYQLGVDSVRWMQKQWNRLEKDIDPERFKQTQMLLAIQEKEAVRWKDACLLYFQTFSKMPIPPTVEKPNQTLEYYQSLKHPFAPGIGGNN
jgi:alpha-glucuronidase